MSETERKAAEKKFDTMFVAQKAAYDQYAQNLKEAQDLAKIRESFQNAIGETKTLGNNLQSLGLPKIGAALNIGADIVTSFSKLAGINGFTAMAGPSAILPGINLAVGAMTLISILDSDGEDGLAVFAAQVMQMMQTLFQEVRTLRQEMHQRFDKLDERIIELYELLYKHHLYMENKLDQIKTIATFSTTEISELLKVDIFIKIIGIIRNIETNTLPDNAEKLKEDLNHLDIFATSISKLNSFNGANLLSNSLFDPTTQTQLELRSSIIDNISFYINYAKDILKIDDLMIGADIPNFNIFYKTSQAFINLVIQASMHDQEVNDSKDKLITKINANYINKTLLTLSRMNDDIVSVMEKLKSADVVGKVIEQYKAEVNEFSQYIHDQMVKYSEKLKINGLKDGSSIFSPNYHVLATVNNLYSANHWWTCFIGGNIPFTGEKAVGLYQEDTGYNSQHRCHNQILINELTKTNALHNYIPHSQNVHINSHINLAIPASSDKSSRLYKTRYNVNQHIYPKLNKIREDFFKALKIKKEYQEYFLKLATLENLAKTYAQLSGTSLPSELDFSKALNAKLIEMEKTSADKVIINLKDSQVITDHYLVINQAHDVYLK